MVRFDSQKRAFIIAVMVILLCLACITGATLALFTSSTEDGKIGVNVTSGKLKADIIDSSDDPESLVGDVLDFITTAESDKVQFEPGAVFYTEGFRVKNIGNIPMNFIVYISEDESLSSDFSDAFEVWITNDPSRRESSVKLQEFDGRLEPSRCSDVYYLVFRMKETAGNEFQNKIFTGVGITVCAIQGNADIE